MVPVPRTPPPSDRDTLASELWGGGAAMLVALPATIAYGVAAYAPLGVDWVAAGVQAALIGAIILGLATAAVGGSSRLISTPSAPAAAVLASVAHTMVSGAHPLPAPEAFASLAAIAVLAGILQLAYGAVGGGRLIKFIPYPVVAGYLSAVAVMIVLGQLPKFLGAATTTRLPQLLTSPSLWQWPALLIGGATVVGMVAAPRLTQRVPAAIVGLATGVLVYFALGAVRPGLWTLVDNHLVLGRIPPILPLDHSGSGSVLHAIRTIATTPSAILVPAVTLSILLSVDTLKTCVILDALTFSRHDSNRALLGQGLGNALSALVGGMPGSGTMGATLVNHSSGGRTRLSGACEALFLLTAIVLFGRWVGWVPLAGLAGILLVVAFRMFDWPSIHLLRQRSTVLDFLVIVTVVAVAVTTNLIAAAGAGVGLAIILFIRDQARGSVIRRKLRGDRTSSKQHRLAAEQAILEQYGRQTTICELQGTLFFGTTDQLLRELESDLKETRFLILDLRRVQSVDYTATRLFVQFEAMLRPRHGWLLFSRVPARRELRDLLIVPEEGRNAKTFATLDDALQWTEDQILADHQPSPLADEAPLPLDGFELTREFADDGLLSDLAHVAIERRFAAGAAIFQCGDNSDELFLVRRGIVRVTLPLNGTGYHTLATFGRGHFFGEMAFLVRGVRSANAVATTDTAVYVISRSQFDAISRAHPVLGVKMFARLARALAVRLRRADAELRAFYDA